MEEQDHPQLYKIRHSLAHVLAQAVQEKFPKAKLGFGPPTDTGFFYDFDFGGEELQKADLKDIEKRMRKIINAKQPFTRDDVNADAAKTKLAGQGDESYKIENVSLLESRGVENFSFYTNGPFLDLCEGPHVNDTGELPKDSFKLDRVAGAYWLGNEKNKMLTRIYGLAFETKEDLKQYIERRQAAEKFDHKKLGKELEIFHQEDIVGKGLPLWLPNGTIIRDEIEKYAKEKEFQCGYKRVSTPHIAKEDLYIKSQHIPAYQDSMFPPMTIEDEGHSTKYYLKSMNCPHHHLIYGSRTRSYRELPLRLAEYGTCYRYEQSGELSGLIRVRAMTMNDAHIYLREEQFEEEFRNVIKMYMDFYSTFKLSQYTFRLSLRGSENAEKFKGDPEMWDKAESMLDRVMTDMKLDFFRAEGEGAFYGPKIDIQFKNLMGREETVSTIQVDFLSPENFGLNYIDESGAEKRPVIIHRSPLSTHERFLSFLIEYYGGAFPTWCAPVQVALIPVNEECLEYTQSLADELTSQFVRVEIDNSSNSFSKKIRTNTVRKTPNIMIIGQKEVEDETLTWRRYGIEEQKTISRNDFIEELRQEIKNRTMLREPMGSII